MAPATLISRRDGGWVPWVYDPAVLFCGGRLSALADGLRIGDESVGFGSTKVAAFDEGAKCLGVQWSLQRSISSTLRPSAAVDGIVREFLLKLS